MQPAKRVAVATVTAKESAGSAARLWTVVAVAVYIRFWFDLCHLINQTNTTQRQKTKSTSPRRSSVEFIELYEAKLSSRPIT